LLKKIVFIVAATLVGTISAQASAQTIEDALANVNEGLEACIRDQVMGNTSAPATSLTALTCVPPAPPADNYDVVTLFGIDQFSALQSLTVRQQGLGGSPALDDVAQLPVLTALDLSFNALTDISDLAGLSNLTSLRLAGNELSDVSATLQTLTSLTLLDLQDNQISTVGSGAGSGVAALTNLIELYLSDNQIGALPTLDGLDALTTLQASRNQLTTAGISSLADLVDNASTTDTSLTSLNLALNQIASIDVVAALGALQDLIVSDNQLSDIDAVADLDALETLSIENFDPAAPNNSISSLAPLTSSGGGDPLELLFGSGNFLSTVEGLADKPNLQLVFLDNNEIRDISGFAGSGQLPMLAEMDLSGNFVQSFYFSLAQLPASSLILLFDNPLLCADVDNFFGAGAALFNPVALIDQSSPTNTSTACSLDADNDNFGEFRPSLAAFPEAVFDRFPADASASLDTDADGAPDAFNPGQSAGDSTSVPPLFIDAFPFDVAASVDSDNDGAPDAFNDGRTAADSTSTPPLFIDAFPNDLAASQDSDGDNCPFPWNPGRDESDSTSTPPLVFDALPDDAADCIDADEDGIGPSREATAGTSDSNPDFDDDGLLDGEEVLVVGTLPTNPDTDGDDFSDFDEVDFGSDPLDANDIPLNPGLNIPLIFTAIQQSQQ
jgi:Leucine-rich repeat (LRR) protein